MVDKHSRQRFDSENRREPFFQMKNAVAVPIFGVLMATAGIV
jgi:hypothetical protein